MFKRDVAFPVLVARLSYLLGSVTCAVVRSPVFLGETPAFQIKRDSPEHFLGNGARLDPRLGAIDQRVDQYASFLRRKRLIVDRISHLEHGRGRRCAETQPRAPRCIHQRASAHSAADDVTGTRVPRMTSLPSMMSGFIS